MRWQTMLTRFESNVKRILLSFVCLKIRYATMILNNEDATSFWFKTF